MKLVIEVPDKIYNTFHEGNWSVTYDDILDYLEQKSCEDCISRQAVDDAIYDYSRSCDVNYEQIMEFIDKLPPVTPRRDLAETSQDCISREAVDKLSRDLVHVTRDKADFLCNFWEGLNALPPVTPQRPKGKWIETPVENDIVPVVFKCSECGMRVVNPYKYCPNCGSDNGGEEDG